MSQSLETQHCNLSPSRENDRDETFALYQSEAVRRYLGGAVGRASFDTSFDNMLATTTSHKWIIRLKNDGAFVGLVSIAPHHDGEDQEVSYQILPEYWGKGLAFETLTAVLDFAAETLKLESIVAETQASNSASRKLLEKLGFTFERGITRFGKEQIIYHKDCANLQ
jgi:ribosomal-protein-alanine N-acetyltransferase